MSSRLLWPFDAACVALEELEHGRVVSGGDVEDDGEGHPLLRVIGAAEQREAVSRATSAARNVGLFVLNVRSGPPATAEERGGVSLTWT